MVTQFPRAAAASPASQLLHPAASDGLIGAQLCPGLTLRRLAGVAGAGGRPKARSGQKKLGGMGGKRKEPPSGSAQGMVGAIGDRVAAQEGGAQKSSLGRTRERPSEDTLHRVLPLLLAHMAPETSALCFEVCNPWSRELEARGFCSRTVRLCSAIAGGGDVERIEQIAIQLFKASSGDVDEDFYHDAVALLGNLLGWEGSLHECLQAASQEPDASFFSRGAASTAKCLGLPLVRWVGKPQSGCDGDPCEPSGHSAANGAPCVAISRDGKHIVSGSDDQLVKVWNAATGAEVVISEMLLGGCNLGSRSGLGDVLDL